MRRAYIYVTVFVGVALCGLLRSGVATAAEEATLLSGSLPLPPATSAHTELQLVRNPHHEEKHHKKHYEPEDYDRRRRSEPEDYDRPRRSEERRGARSVVCKSKEYQYKSCSLNRRGREVRLVRQLSDTRCVRGDNWGANRNGIWVDRGCSGRFELE